MTTVRPLASLVRAAGRKQELLGREAASMANSGRCSRFGEAAVRGGLSKIWTAETSGTGSVWRPGAQALVRDLPGREASTAARALLTATAAGMLCLAPSLLRGPTVGGFSNEPRTTDTQENRNSWCVASWWQGGYYNTDKFPFYDPHSVSRRRSRRSRSVALRLAVRRPSGGEGGRRIRLHRAAVRFPSTLLRI